MKIRSVGKIGSGMSKELQKGFCRKPKKIEKDYLVIFGKDDKNKRCSFKDCNKPAYCYWSPAYENFGLNYCKECYKKARMP